MYMNKVNNIYIINIIIIINIYINLYINFYNTYMNINTYIFVITKFGIPNIHQYSSNNFYIYIKQYS